jgi:hypothetical protein
MTSRIHGAKPVYLNGTNKWYIEVQTESLGRVLLLDKNYPDLPIPVTFDTELEAAEYMEEWKKGLNDD